VNIDIYVNIGQDAKSTDRWFFHSFTIFSAIRTCSFKPNSFQSLNSNFFTNICGDAYASKIYVYIYMQFFRFVQVDIKKTKFIWTRINS